MAQNLMITFGQSLSPQTNAAIFGSRRPAISRSQRFVASPTFEIPPQSPPQAPPTPPKGKAKLPLTPGIEVRHPQWGRGTVLFDKPHCIGIRFLEYGQVNFSQEEWHSGHSPSSRFQSVSDLEYTLSRSVEDGEISEEEAEKLLARKVHPFEVRRKTLSLNEAFERFKSHSLSEDDFYKNLLLFLTKTVKNHSPDPSTFSNIEDAISESALEVWQRLAQFDASRSSFSTFVSLIALHNVQDALRRYRFERGGSPHVQFEEQEGVQWSLSSTQPLSAERQLLFDEWMNTLGSKDREVVQMVKDGLTQEEIASALNISQPAVTKRLARLKRNVRSPF